MELTQEDRQRIEQEARLHYSANNNYPMEQAAFKKGAEYATIFERQKQVGMASEAYAAGLYRASNADDSESFEDFRRRKNLMTKQDMCGQPLNAAPDLLEQVGADKIHIHELKAIEIHLQKEKSDLLAKVSEQEKEIEDAKYWANEQAKGLNAATDRNFELQTELTKANHSILSLTNQVSEQSQRITNLIEVKDKLYYRCEELTEQVERQNVLYESRGDAMDELKVENSRLRDERKDYARLLNELIGFIDSGYLVRDISNDHKPDWAMKQFPFLKTLAEIKSLLSKFEAPNQS